MLYFPVSSNIQDVAAPQLLGPLWNWCLYGALVVQLYVYSYNFSQDNKHIKLLVYGIFLLETIQTALSGADLYYWFAAGFGDSHHLSSPFASFIDLPIMGSLVSLSVQIFFAYRIRVLSLNRSRWLCFTIRLFSIIGASGAFISGLFSLLSEAFLEGILLLFLKIWLVGNTLSDMLIVSAMIYHLRRKNSYPNNHILVRIVRLTVETNLVTTTVSIVSLLMIALYPDKNWYVCPTYLLGKLYSNTLLVSLNNRISFRDANRAAGGLVDLQAVPPSNNGDNPQATMGAIAMRPEMSEKNLLRPSAEVDGTPSVADIA